MLIQCHLQGLQHLIDEILGTQSVRLQLICWLQFLNIWNHGKGTQVFRAEHAFVIELLGNHFSRLLVSNTILHFDNEATHVHALGACDVNLGNVASGRPQLLQLQNLLLSVHRPKVV